MADPAASVDTYFQAREQRGRLLVNAIVAVNAVLTVVAFCSSVAVGTASFGRFLAMLFWLFVYVMLYMGQSWARWLFVIAAAINAITIVMLLFTLLGLPAGSVSGAVIFALVTGVLGAVVMVVSGALLLFSGPVNDFLYGQDAG